MTGQLSPRSEKLIDDWLEICDKDPRIPVTFSRESLVEYALVLLDTAGLEVSLDDNVGYLLQLSIKRFQKHIMTRKLNPTTTDTYIGDAQPSDASLTAKLPLDLDLIDELLSDITPGNWRWEADPDIPLGFRGCVIETDHNPGYHVGRVASCGDEGNAAFIASAPTIIRVLLAEVRRLRESQ